MRAGDFKIAGLPEETDAGLDELWEDEDEDDWDDEDEWEDEDDEEDEEDEEDDDEDDDWDD